MYNKICDSAGNQLKLFMAGGASMFKRPGVAGAVLQTPLLLIY